MRTFNLIVLSLVVVIFGTQACYAVPILQNPSFESGSAASVTHWHLSGPGKWVTGNASDGKHYVSVSGSEGDRWYSDPVSFSPGNAYEIKFSARVNPQSAAGSAFAVISTSFATQLAQIDPGVPAGKWKDYAVRILAPASNDGATSEITLGSWQLNGTIDFDNVRIFELKPVHLTAGKVTLGEGESISGNSYKFTAPLDTCKGISRPLQAHNAVIHDNRWRFQAPGNYVIYHHNIGSGMQTDALVKVDIWFHEATSYAMSVAVSIDGITYQDVGTVKYVQGTSAYSFSIPSDMLPARDIYVKLSLDSKDSSKPTMFQVPQYTFSSKIDGSPQHITGQTDIYRVDTKTSGIAIAPLLTQSTGEFTARITNISSKTVTLIPVLSLKRSGEMAKTFKSNRVSLKPKEIRIVKIPNNIISIGSYEVSFSLGTGAPGQLTCNRTITALDASGYGELLKCGNKNADVWWASSGWKVSKQTPLPASHAQSVRITVAGNEAEAAQIIIRPKKDLSNLTAKVDKLVSADGAVLPPSAVEVLRVRYVSVEYASDQYGRVGDWPDPLPPFKSGISVMKEQNQPLWVRVTAPKSAKAGVYKGNVIIKSNGFNTKVPLEVKVYGFSLPDTTTCKTMFGYSPGNIIRYHNLKSDTDQRTVLNKYLDCFSKHRISPYNPAPLDTFGYEWQTDMEWDGGQTVTGDAHSGSKSLLTTDDSQTSNLNISNTRMLTLSHNPLKLSFWYRTESPTQPALIYLTYYTEGKQWIPNNNLQFILPASAKWTLFETTISNFPDTAVYFKPVIQGCMWTEKGDATSSIWVDDFSIKDSITGAELIRNNDFESDQNTAVKAKLVFDTEKWGKAMRSAMDEYHFNTFVFYVPGLGGGTFYSRDIGSILGYKQGTPEHTELFKKWCDGARGQLTSLGLLDKAIVYPFDEPSEKDYDFVVDQLRMIRDNFPGLRKIIPMTLVVPNPFVGYVDMWCPILNTHNKQFAKERQKAGDLYTWYICCAPKYPYIANFIDRPATDLRVWLWQTWKEGVNGVLIWESTWWTSPEAYPNAPQNPYTDSMSYVSGYGTPVGSMQRWNAGDGRFMYPPESATGTQSEAILDDPVSSIRWEALRDGLEDYEYLAMLRNLIQQKKTKLKNNSLARYESLLKVPESITRSLQSYTQAPTPILERRSEIARAIEELSRL